MKSQQIFPIRSMMINNLQKKIRESRDYHKKILLFRINNLKALKENGDSINSDLLRDLEKQLREV